MVPPSGLEPERPKPTHFKCVEFANFSKVAMAEAEGFEPSETYISTVFKTASFDRSDKLPFK